MVPEDAQSQAQPLIHFQQVPRPALPCLLDIVITLDIMTTIIMPVMLQSCEEPWGRGCELCRRCHELEGPIANVCPLTSS